MGAQEVGYSERFQNAVEVCGVAQSFEMTSSHLCRSWACKMENAV